MSRPVGHYQSPRICDTCGEEFFSQHASTCELCKEKLKYKKRAKKEAITKFAREAVLV